MKKIIAIALLIPCFSFFFACSKSETYADKLKKERKYINSLRNDSGFVFLNEYPKNGVFQPNQFYRDPQTGTYICVIDSGNGRRAKTTPPTDVYVRFRNTYFLGMDTIVRFSNDDQLGIFKWINFSYGQTNTYTYNVSEDYNNPNYLFKSHGLVAPLNYVGENAIVKLIVPFSSGSAYQNNTSVYKPVYFGYVKYNFRPDQE